MLSESWMLQILDTRMGFPSPTLNVVIDYFSHFCLKMCKICLKRTLDATFLDCLALTFCDVIGELLPEWARLTLQDGTTFLLTSNLADIPVSRVRINFLSGIFVRFAVRWNVVTHWRTRQAHCGSKSPMTLQNLNAKQSRKEAYSVHSISISHI